VVLIPDVPSGLSGTEEEEAFGKLPPPPAELVASIARLVLMVVLPALVEEDLAAFGRGITEVQRLVGETFLPAMGGRFAHARVAELVDALLAEGAAGAGQSSWGPAVYGLFQGDEAASRVAERFADRLGGRGRAFATSFNNSGARCWATRTPSDPSRR
jgi:beta-RFAP synthase